MSAEAGEIAGERRQFDGRQNAAGGGNARPKPSRPAA